MKLWKTLWIVLLSLIATAIGLYIYPTTPAVVWILLALCWVCYRLSLRAEALFGKREPTQRRRPGHP